jgi:AcrR family transcriptional regulator
MNRPRGRPAPGAGLEREAILKQALALLDEGGGQGLTMRALAARLGVSPMSLYRHVGDRDALLQALSDRVYAQVLDADDGTAGPRAQAAALLLRYHATVANHPQLALALFAAPDALAGVTGRITRRLDHLLAALTDAPLAWRDILVDHAHGSGLARAAQAPYRQALERLLDRLSV